MICIEAMRLATEPIDMRAGTNRLLARVVQVLGTAQAHHGYLFETPAARASSCVCTMLNADRFVDPSTGHC